MLSPLDFIVDLFNPDLAFLGKALIVALASSIVCGVMGCYVVLRGMAFIGDAVAHAVFPGLAVAFVLQGSLVLGGMVAGVLTALLVALFAHNRRMKADSVIGVLFVAAFALGIVIISQAPGYAGSLQQFLFGAITGISSDKVLLVCATGLVLLILAFLFHKELVMVSLDREMAQASGLRVLLFDMLLYAMVAIAIVISVQTIGNVLVLALLITPAAAARLLTDRLIIMMLLAPVLGAIAAVFGMYLSWSLNLPVGGTIVLTATALFVLAWLFAPRHGLISSRLKRTLNKPEKDRSEGKARVKTSDAAKKLAAAAASLTLIAGAALTQFGSTGAGAVADPPTDLTGKTIVQDVHTDAVSAYADDGRLVLASSADIDVNGDGRVDLASRLDPSTTVFHVSAASATKIPAGVTGYEFIAEPETVFWMAPQTQQPGIIWPGFSTESASLAAHGITAVDLRLKQVNGPGKLEMFTSSAFGVNRLFSSTEKLPDWTLNVPQHTHLNWAFTAEGLYQLTFEATATVSGTKQRAENTYLFYVGDLPTGGGSGSGTGDGSDGTGNLPGDLPGGLPGDLPGGLPGGSAPGATQPAPAPAPAPAAPAAPNNTGTTPIRPGHSAQYCAPALTLDSGHIDLFTVSAAGGVAALQIKEDVTGRHVLRQPETTLIRVGEHALRGVPAGYPGAGQGYVLPLTQESNLPWPGWDTNGTAASGYTDVKINITSVTGPGQVHLYSIASFGGWRSLLTTGGSLLPGTLHEPRPAHTHAQWVFTNPGVYRISAYATATNPATGRTLTTALRQYVFQVGNAPLGNVFCGANPGAGAAQAAAVAAALPAEQRASQAAAAQQADQEQQLRAAAQADAVKAKAAEDLKQRKQQEQAKQKNPVADFAAAVKRRPLAAAGVMGFGGGLSLVLIAGLTAAKLRKLRG